MEINKQVKTGTTTCCCSLSNRIVPVYITKVPITINITSQNTSRIAERTVFLLGLALYVVYLEAWWMVNSPYIGLLLCIR